MTPEEAADEFEWVGGGERADPADRALVAERQGFSADTLEPRRAPRLCHLIGPELFTTFGFVVTMFVGLLLAKSTFIQPTAGGEGIVVNQPGGAFWASIGLGVVAIMCHATALHLAGGRS